MPIGYLRYPDIRGDEVVFVADDDLWSVSTAGGPARRLTADHTPVRSPRLSPDGRRIAFASARDAGPGGGRDVHVLDREEGRVRRLTWWGVPTTAVVGWLDDERIVVASTFEGPFPRTTALYALGLDGSLEALPYRAAMSLAIGPAGAVAITTPNSRDAAMWKRYRGGTASRLWLDADGSGQWVRVPDSAAGVYSPGWVGDRLIFASDLGASLAENPDEPAQLWSLDARGGDLRAHTAHRPADADAADGVAAGDGPRGYVRDPRTDGERVVYHALGRLYVLDSLDAEPRELEVDLGPLPEPRRAIEPAEQRGVVAPDRTGSGSLIDWHGQAWWLTHRGGPARRVLGGDDRRVREPAHLGDTGEVVAVTDADGEDALVVARADGQGEVRRLEAGDLGRVLSLAASPDGTQVLTISHDGAIRLVDVAAGSARLVSTSTVFEAVDPTFSPDSRYVVWGEPVAAFGNRRLLCLDTSDPAAEPVVLTSGRFDDHSPAFTRDGRYLAFLSARTVDPAYAAFTFDLGFGDATRPWLVPLRADEPAPFGPTADGWPMDDVITARDERASDSADQADEKADGAAAEGAKDGAKKGDEAPTCEFDTDGFEDRMVPFPVPSGDYTHLRAAHDAVLWIRVAHRTGELGAARAGVSGHAPRDVLQRYSLPGRTLDDLGDVTTYEISGDGKRLVLVDGDDLLVVPSSHAVDGDDPARLKVDTRRLRRDVDLRAQWRQMFDENGRIMRDHYWRADMDGVDWAAVLAGYRPLIERIATDDDLADVLWETVGELNTSHAYVSPVPRGDGLGVGRLGADLRRDADGAYVVERILPGDSSDPAARSPLRAAGVAARPGDRIVAVDGRPVAGEPDLGRLLEGGAERVVELTLERDGTRRRVAVQPLADEEGLRYQDWVAGRRAYVDRVSSGRLGYVHVPDMQAFGWAQFHRDLDETMRREGVVVDVRWNRGGHTSQLIIERLSRRVLGWDLPRHSADPEPYPFQAARGPLAFLANQWSGSDGDIVNVAVQTLGLGPVIGERTWGGVIGIDGRFDLVDGTGITQPRYASWYRDHGWGVENHGVDPDIEVTLTPADWAAGGDPQLDRAVAYLLERLEQTPAATPPELPAPRASRK